MIIATPITQPEVDLSYDKLASPTQLCYYYQETFCLFGIAIASAE